MTSLGMRLRSPILSRSLLTACCARQVLRRHGHSPCEGEFRKARTSGFWSGFLIVLAIAFESASAFELKPDGYHVRPSDDLQFVVNLAAANPTMKVVRFEPGTYTPKDRSQALIYLNRKHDGVQLIGIGRPTLTAANPEVAIRSEPSFPAVVNHVLYLGDGLSTNTLIAHFRITGANHFVTNSFLDQMEPDRSFRKGRFYFGDGGAVKIYHRSYPVLRDLEIAENYASPCAGGVSIQHEGATNGWVLIEDCVFRKNRAEVTGAALDLLWGSQARVVNCLFEENVSNTGPGEGENPFNNNGAITVFPRSRLHLERCSIVGNRNGLDEQGGLSTLVDCLFAKNELSGGAPNLPRYELDLQRGGVVRGCVFVGQVLDPTSAIRPQENQRLPSTAAIPTDPTFEGRAIGYRPVVPRP